MHHVDPLTSPNLDIQTVPLIRNWETTGHVKQDPGVITPTILRVLSVQTSTELFKHMNVFNAYSKIVCVLIKA